MRTNSKNVHEMAVLLHLSIANLIHFHLFLLVKESNHYIKVREVQLEHLDFSRVSDNIFIVLEL